MSKIIYFPVDNGDTSLISVTEGAYTTDIMVDCNIRKSSAGTANEDQYDVKADLLKRLKKKTVNGVADVNFTDVFILTHGDEDHLRGFEQNFYQGAPTSYTKKNQEDGEIFIDVLWFSPMVMGTEGNEDEKCFNKEAKRRIKLHRDKSPDRNLPGNRIVIIGYDGNEKLDDLDIVRKMPGDVVNRFNERDMETFSVFIHSPYQKDLKDEEVDKNRVSVVFQARFKQYSWSSEYCTLAMFGGDANHEAWDTILKYTKKHRNDVLQQALKWDLFLACHHCSWTFFGEYDQPATTTSKEVLNNKRGQYPKVIASCKEIIDNDDDPPCYTAKLEYEKVVTAKYFWCTANHNKSGKTPQPIIFDITPQGPAESKAPEGSAKVAGAGGLSSVNSTSNYGSL